MADTIDYDKMAEAIARALGGGGGDSATTTTTTEGADDEAE